jgi:arginase
MSFQVSCRGNCGLFLKLIVHSGGQGRAGVDLAPIKLVSAGLIGQLTSLGWEVNYTTQQSFADIPYNPLPADSPQAPKDGVNGASDPTPEEALHPKFLQRLPDPDIGNMKKPRLVSAVCERVAKEVGDNAKEGYLPLTLGGDHSLVSSATEAVFPGRN